MPAPANAGVPISPYLSSDGTSTATATPLRNQSLTLDYTKVISSNTINEARAGVVRWNIDINPIGNAFNTATAVGIPGININNHAGGLPGLTITGFQVIGDSSTYPEYSRMTIFQYEDNLTLVRGTHTFKFGGQFLRNRFNGFSAFPTRGTYTFNGQFTRQTGGSTALRLSPISRWGRLPESRATSLQPNSACASGTWGSLRRIAGGSPIGSRSTMACAMKSTRRPTTCTITGRTSM